MYSAEYRCKLLIEGNCNYARIMQINAVRVRVILTEYNSRLVRINSQTIITVRSACTIQRVRKHKNSPPQNQQK